MNIVTENIGIDQPSVKYIYHHLGLGDCFICHGILREYAKHNKVISFCKPKYYQTVSFMYRDDNNIQILPYDDNEVIQFLRFNHVNNNNFIGIGYAGNNWNTSITDKSFDQVFYEQANIPFEKRYENFHVVRVLNREMRLFNDFKIKEKEYIFVHDDPTRGFNINKNLPDGIPIIRNTLGSNIFDYAYLIENALEVHVMESSFKLMIDLWSNLKQDNLYFHRYSRDIIEGSFLQSKRIKNWTLIN